MVRKSCRMRRVGILVKEEIFGNAMEVGREMIRIIYAYAPPKDQKQRKFIYKEAASEWDSGNSSEIIISLGILIDMQGMVLRTSYQTNKHRRI